MESCWGRKSSHLRVHFFILRVNVDARQIVFRQWKRIDMIIFFIYPTFHREPVTCGWCRRWADRRHLNPWVHQAR